MRHGTKTPGQGKKQRTEVRGQRTARDERWKEKLVIEVSRTWVPHEVLGNFDRREMGVGVKIVSAEN